LEYLLAREDIDRITYLHLEFVGPDRCIWLLRSTWPATMFEHDLAVRLRHVERELEQEDAIEEAVLTLATPDEVSLTP
jgi:hypothetical protein